MKNLIGLTFLLLMAQAGAEDNNGAGAATGTGNTAVGKKGGEEPAPKAKTPKTIEILKPVAGAFMLPYNVGQKIPVGAKGVSKKQASLMIEAGYAK